MRGSTPLDVAAASCIDNNELALALQEQDLEKVIVSDQSLISVISVGLKFEYFVFTPFIFIAFIGRVNPLKRVFP